MRGAAAIVVALLAATAGGCAGDTKIESGAVLRVYVSMPLRGPSGADGRDVDDGARLALADAGGRAGGVDVRATYLDDTSGAPATARWSAAQTGANARGATQDTSAIAYIGDFESGATRTSEPITNEARLLQVSPASGAVGLTRPFAGSEQLPVYEQAADARTFGRVIPDDYAQGRAAAGWARKLGYERVGLLLGDHSSFSISVRTGFQDAGEGLLTGKGPLDAIFYAGDAAGEPSKPFRGRNAFRGPVMATDALISPWSAGTRPTVDLATSAALDPSQLPPAGQRFVRRFRARYDRAPGRYAAYGYESMAVVLDSIDRASADSVSRGSVVDAFFGTTDRASVLGTYSIDPLGDTTLDRMTGYRVGPGGALSPSAALRSR